MIHVLVEENYRENPRFLRLVDGLASRERRRSDVAIYSSVEEIPREVRPVILIPQSASWTERMIGELSRVGLYPLVFGHRYLELPYEHSSITPDYTRAAYRLTRYVISAKGGGRVAILGYNGDSVPDRLKYIGIRRAVGEAGCECEIFKNSGDVSGCLSSFAERAGEFSVAVCCNDNIAVALCTRYPSVADGLAIASCSASRISEFFKKPYPVCRIDYLAAGEMLGRLADLIARDESFPSTAMTFDMEVVCDGEEPPESPAQGGDEVDFYGDGGLYRMECLNRVLEYADALDLSILAGIASGETYGEIAERCYAVVGTVKYRTKRMLEQAGVESRRELSELLTEFSVAEELISRAKV